MSSKDARPACKAGIAALVGSYDTTSLIQIGLGDDPLLDEEVVYRLTGCDELVNLALVGAIDLGTTGYDHVVSVVNPFLGIALCISLLI